MYNSAKLELLLALITLHYRSTFTDFIVMSLVEDGYLLELWKEAQKPSSLESASVASWNQLFSKYIFAENLTI
jgi:hypothetical protein